MAALGTTPAAGDPWQVSVVDTAAFAFQGGLAFLMAAQLRNCAPAPSAPSGWPGPCCTSSTRCSLVGCVVLGLVLATRPLTVAR